LHRGLGLGLAIVRHLTELHGGTVSAASDGEGRGSSFKVRIPLAANVLPAPKESEPAISASPVLALTGVRVLLVEDEADARELLSLTLKISGANVQAVESAQDALFQLPLFKPHVLLSDVGLPRESGYELIRQVRALNPDLGEVPAVALTAFASEKDRDLALSSGFQVHLAKPVEPDLLIETIRRLANGNQNLPQ
jgi:CheY-like chemotaxis protein